MSSYFTNLNSVLFIQINAIQWENCIWTCIQLSNYHIYHTCRTYLNTLASSRVDILSYYSSCNIAMETINHSCKLVSYRWNMLYLTNMRCPLTNTGHEYCIKIWFIQLGFHSCPRTKIQAINKRLSPLVLNPSLFRRYSSFIRVPSKFKYCHIKLLIITVLFEVFYKFFGIKCIIKKSGSVGVFCLERISNSKGSD